MPRTVFDRKNPYDKLVSLVRGTAITADKSYADLGRMAGCSNQTIAHRLHDPSKMTLGELTSIGRGLNIPIEDLRAAIQYR